MSQEISFEIHQQFAAQQSTNVVKASIYFPVLRVKCMYVLVLLAIFFVINYSTSSVIYVYFMIYQCYSA